MEIRRVRNRQVLIGAARAFDEARGEKVTWQSIATQAGYSRRTVIRYARTKADLLADIVDLFFDGMVECLREKGPLDGRATGHGLVGAIENEDDVVVARVALAAKDLSWLRRRTARSRTRCERALAERLDGSPGLLDPALALDALKHDLMARAARRGGGGTT